MPQMCLKRPILLQKQVGGKAGRMEHTQKWGRQKIVQVRSNKGRKQVGQDNPRWS